MNETLYKYELPVPVVQYLLRALERQQISGSQQAKDLLAVQELLQNPLNKEDLEKEALENLKAKYEPITSKKEDK